MGDQIASFDLQRLMEGTIRQLRAEADCFTKLTSHPGEKGRLNESHLVRVMRRYLPQKFSLGTGFVVSGGATIRQSRQCDIIIYDGATNAPFYASDAWQIYPIEMVYGIVEVKTAISLKEIRDAFEKCILLREMSGEESNPNKAYIRQRPITAGKSVEYDRYKTGLPPRFFIFGYNGPQRKQLDKWIRQVTEEMPRAHLHGLCQLEDAKALYLRHAAYRAPNDRTSNIDDNGMLSFLLEMPQLLNSMHSVSSFARTDAHDSYSYRSENFDLVDLDHYRGLRL
ncbi:MAG: DUF6602 domain-containing protein [Hyphomonadaceae bacterium]